MNLEVLHGSRLQKRTCNEPESRVALTSHDRSIAQACDLWALRTWQYWRQVPQRQNYRKFDHRQMWPGGSFPSLPETFIHKPSFLAQWPQQSGSQTLIFHKLCVFECAVVHVVCVWGLWVERGHSFFLQICPPINLCWDSLWLWPSKTKAPISRFSTPLKLKWVLELALQTSKINILMPQALVLYEEPNQLLPGWLHSRLRSKENRFL